MVEVIAQTRVHLRGMTSKLARALERLLAELVFALVHDNFMVFLRGHDHRIHSDIVSDLQNRVHCLGLCLVIMDVFLAFLVRSCFFLGVFKDRNFV